MVILPTEKRFDWKYPPVMLFTLVMVNLLIFFVYQSDDTQRFQKTVSYYQSVHLLDNEWPAYQQYLQQQGKTELEQKLTGLLQSNRSQLVIYSIVGDRNFWPYLQNHPEQLVFDPYDVDDTFIEWETQRLQVQRLYQRLSGFAFGLIPDEFSITQLISYQFLHGDLMHLLGNLFFLVFCGFAVEAAIGPWLFLGLYLAAGAAGGLAYCAINWQNSMPLVGASASISGVIAMYVAIFRLRRIEFFYWILAFAGYFRAPALLILPLFIAKELVSWLSDSNSHIAYVAHVGGFIGGGFLVGLTYWLRPQLINNDYVEEDQTSDPERESLARIYSAIEQYRFKTALSLLKDHTQNFGQSIELALLHYHLSLPFGPKACQTSLQELLRAKATSNHQQLRQVQAWQESQQLYEFIEPQTRLKFALGLPLDNHLDEVENIFKQLQASTKTLDNQPTPYNSDLGILARKLAVYFEKQQQHDKAKLYHRYADDFITAAL